MPQSHSVNRRIVLAERPRGMPTLANFRMEEAPVPTPADGEVLLRALYLSLDPYMRGRMSDAKSYVAPYEVGEVMTGGAIGEVIESTVDDFQPGDKYPACDERSGFFDHHHLCQ